MALEIIMAVLGILTHAKSQALQVPVRPLLLLLLLLFWRLWKQLHRY